MPTPIESGNLKTFGEYTIAALKAKLVLSRTIWNNTSATDLRTPIGAGGYGGTVDFVTDLILPGEADVHTAADRAALNPFTYHNAEQQMKSITLTDYQNYGYAWNYNEQTFVADSLANGLVTGAASKVARGIEDRVVGLFNTLIAGSSAATVVLDGTPTENTAKILREILRLRTEFNARGVDGASRTIAISGDIATELLSSDQFRDVSQSGSPEALVNATFTRPIHGFTVVEDNSLALGSIVAYEKNAFGLVLRPAAKSNGAIKDELVTRDGYTLNVTVDRDGSNHRDLVTVGTFVGADIIDPLKTEVAKFSFSAGV